jgi:hypothetical protein
MNLAYINGVLHGDGWCKQKLGLRVKDYDFCQAFSIAVYNATGINKEPRLDERGYWLYRVGNNNGKFNFLLDYQPSTIPAYIFWLRGLFDSEGNAQLDLIKNFDHSYRRRIAFYSTNINTLETAKTYLAALDITSSIKNQTNSKSHKGTKPVFELRIYSNKANFERFSQTVSSNIERKRIVINKMAGSYCTNTKEHYRSAQRKGAAAKHNKTINKTLPCVIKGIKHLIDNGIKPTQRACRAIPGYNTVQRYFSQSILVDMATNL